MTNPIGLALRGLIMTYRLFLSPLLGPRCRFQPTCSEYALDALATHGVIRGAWYALRRLLRCHPWGGAGYDPVPLRQGPGGPYRIHALDGRQHFHVFEVELHGIGDAACAVSHNGKPGGSGIIAVSMVTHTVDQYAAPAYTVLPVEAITRIGRLRQDEPGPHDRPAKPDPGDRAIDRHPPRISVPL